MDSQPEVQQVISMPFGEMIVGVLGPTLEYTLKLSCDILSWLFLAPDTKKPFLQAKDASAGQVEKHAKAMSEQKDWPEDPWLSRESMFPGLSLAERVMRICVHLAGARPHVLSVFLRVLINSLQCGSKVDRDQRPQICQLMLASHGGKFVGYLATLMCGSETALRAHVLANNLILTRRDKLTPADRRALLDAAFRAMSTLYHDEDVLKRALDVICALVQWDELADLITTSVKAGSGCFLKLAVPKPASSAAAEQKDAHDKLLRLLRARDATSEAPHTAALHWLLAAAKHASPQLHAVHRVMMDNLILFANDEAEPEVTKIRDAVPSGLDMTLRISEPVLQVADLLGAALGWGGALPKQFVATSEDLIFKSRDARLELEPAYNTEGKIFTAMEKSRTICCAPGCKVRASDKKLKLRGRCQKVRFCSVECQKRAWPTHKLVCVRAK